MGPQTKPEQQGGKLLRSALLPPERAPRANNRGRADEYNNMRAAGRLSVTETVLFRLPKALGANVTLIAQVAPPVSVEPQAPKSSLAALPEMVNVDPPGVA